MSKPRNPVKLSNFPSIYEEAVQRTIEKGSLCLDFHTEKEAYSVKFDLYRYFHSLTHYQPDSALAQMCRRIGIKQKGERLELVDKENTESVRLMRAAVEAVKAGKPQATIDQAARDLAALHNDPDYQEISRGEE